MFNDKQMIFKNVYFSRYLICLVDVRTYVGTYSIGKSLGVLEFLIYGEYWPDVFLSAVPFQNLKILQTLKEINEIRYRVSSELRVTQINQNNRLNHRSKPFQKK